MLEVKCSRPEPLFLSEGVDVQTTRMPVDFEAYLLSASPPGFDMYHHLSGAPGMFSTIFLFATSLQYIINATEDDE